MLCWHLSSTEGLRVLPAEEEVPANPLRVPCSVTCRERAFRQHTSTFSVAIVLQQTLRAGILPPEVLLQRALDILIHKCQALLEDL